MIMKSKKIHVIFFFLLLIILSFLLIGIGIYFTYLKSPKTITSKIIDNSHEKLEKYWQEIKKDYIGDTYTLNSKIQYNLMSEKYTKENQTNIDYLKKSNLLLNLNHSQNEIELVKDKKNRKAFISFKQTIGQEEIINTKYLIDNATKYYYASSVLKNYVNDGNSTYFESLSDENSSSIDNIEYLSLVIRESLKENIKESYYNTYQTEHNIAGKDTKVYQISLNLTNKEVRDILKGILNDLKKDPKANKILTGIDDDFPKMKISNQKKILKNQESYTINIYTSTILYKPLKYEVIYINGSERKELSYEGDSSHGTFYYIENDALKYQITSKNTESNTKLTIYDNKDKKIGSLLYEINENGNSLEYDFDNQKEKHHILYSSKYIDYKEKKSYTNNKKISFNIMQDKKSIINGDIKIDSIMKSDAKITEDVSNSVLSSTLTDEQRNKFESIKDTIRERLER